jgi:hypothetical protein
MPRTAGAAAKEQRERTFKSRPNRVKVTEAGHKEALEKLAAQLAQTTPVVRAEGYYAKLGLTTAEQITTFEQEVLAAKRAIDSNENDKKYLGNKTVHDKTIVHGTPMALLSLAAKGNNPARVQALLDIGENPNVVAAENQGEKNPLMFMLQKLGQGQPRALEDYHVKMVVMLIEAGTDLSHFTKALGASPSRSVLGFAKDCKEGPAREKILEVIIQAMQANNIPLTERISAENSEFNAQYINVLTAENIRLYAEIAAKDAEIAKLKSELVAALKHEANARADAALLLNLSHSSHHSLDAPPPAVVVPSTVVAPPTVAALTKTPLNFAYPAAVSGAKRSADEMLDASANISNNNITPGGSHA